MTVSSEWLRGSPINYNWKRAGMSMEKGKVLCCVFNTKEELNAAY